MHRVHFITTTTGPVGVGVIILSAGDVKAVWCSEIIHNNLINVATGFVIFRFCHFYTCYQEEWSIQYRSNHLWCYSMSVQYFCVPLFPPILAPLRLNRSVHVPSPSLFVSFVGRVCPITHCSPYTAVPILRHSHINFISDIQLHKWLHHYLDLFSLIASPLLYYFL